MPSSTFVFALSVVLCTTTLLCSSSAGAQSIAAPPTDAAMSPAPTAAAGGLDCTDAMLNLSSCLTYVEAGSNLTVPDTGCCSGLAGLVNNQPVCLCRLLASNDVYGVKIDTAKALTLPTVCRVQTPPVSLCAVLGVPVSSPMASPSPSSGVSEAPGSSIGSSPVGSTTPTSTPSSSSSSTRLIFTSTVALFLLSLFFTITIF